ncbi:MAG: hypothetical protein M3Z08_12415 [Chloroflexota bacterium]|nr:hypothetical protein [Chloroflexota bacterium]
MSFNIRIFVAADTSLAHFAQELGELLALPAEYQQNRFNFFYRLADANTLYTVVESDFPNLERATGHIVPFEDYRFLIYVDEHSIRKPEKRLQWQQKRAQDAFNALKATNTYRLLMVDDGFNQLDAFTPPGQDLPLSKYAQQAQGLPAHMMIWLASDQPMAAIAADLERLLEIAPQVIPVDDETQYSFLTEQTRYQLVRHRIEHPSNRNYQEYPYIIHVKGRVFTPGERRYWQAESARALFAQLKATGRYYLALLGDFERRDASYEVLDSFEPAH